MPPSLVRCCTSKTPNQIKIMNHTPIYISPEDNTKLRLLLATSLYANAPLARRRLAEELDRAFVIDPSAFPADVVTMDSTVAFEDVATGEVEEYTITFPERADIERKRISILAPIGTTLIGCRVGDVVKWPTPGGVRHLKVRSVATPKAATTPLATTPAFFAGAALA